MSTVCFTTAISRVVGQAIEPHELCKRYSAMTAIDSLVPLTCFNGKQKCPEVGRRPLSLLLCLPIYDLSVCGELHLVNLNISYPKVCHSATNKCSTYKYNNGCSFKCIYACDALPTVSINPKVSRITTNKCSVYKYVFSWKRCLGYPFCLHFLSVNGVRI